MLPNDFKWQKSGNWFTLSCAYRIGGHIFNYISEEIGRIKKKNDGRWEWIVHPCNKHNNVISTKKTIQGVELTKEAAMIKVESYVIPENINTIECEVRTNPCT